MNRYAALAILAVLAAGTTLVQAQSPEAPAVVLGMPIPILPSSADVKATAAPRPPLPAPATPLPLPEAAALQPAPAPLPQTPPVAPLAPVPFPVLPVPEAAWNSFAPVRSAWVQVDYLMWWARGAPTGGPLVTTGPLGAPGTQVLLGDRPMGYGPFSGVQFTGGLPIGDGLSLEAGYFYLGQRSAGFSAGSNANGVPIVARPVIDAQNGTQQAYADSVPGNVAGSVAVASQIRMDGYEFNLGANFVRTESFRFDLLGGFRALDMSESLSIRDQLTALSSGFLTFNGAPLPAGSQETDFDVFATSNHFYGGQLGGRFGWQTGAFSIDAVAKVALGVTQQSVNIDGGSERFMYGASPLTVPGGILALPSNMGHYYRSTFSVVPQTGLEFGYQITPRLRATIGYTLIYWTNVARPGNQTDRTVNPAQVPTDPFFGIGGGPARPSLPAIRESDFWVQGVNFGLAFAF